MNKTYKKYFFNRPFIKTQKVSIKDIQLKISIKGYI